MPSRFGIAVILAFWLAVTGYIGYRDVWPRYFSEAPPPIAIDLADEATQQAATRWSIYRGDAKIGSLSTRMDYQAADDSFRFVNNYTKLTLEAGKFGVGKVELDLPSLTTTVRVNRAGALLEQSMQGEIHLLIGGIELGNGSAEVTGRVVQGVLRGRCLVRYPMTVKVPNIDRELEPVPVPAGQVLNPMMPVNRLRDVTPGRRWVIREVDPLRDAGAVLGKEILGRNALGAGIGMPASENRELIAEVSSDTEALPRRGSPDVVCRIIRYRSEQVTAQTWVAAADGRVMRQEASMAGERLRFERED